MSETRREERALLQKAERSLAVAEELLESGHADFAASRLYYGCFYIAEALLLNEGLRFSRHGQVLAQYGRIFAKPERLTAASIGSWSERSLCGRSRTIRLRQRSTQRRSVSS